MMIIGRLSESSAAQAAEVERICLETAWTESQLRNLPDGSVYLTASDEHGVVGICSARLLGSEAELLNLAVLPGSRRNHVAEELLNRLFRIVSDEGCEKIFLEVAETNLPAIQLYKKTGFVGIGVRRGFYRGIDAILMEKTLC